MITGVQSSRWGAGNQRRIELIRKSTSVNLTPEEQSELDELQAELHERLEATDQQLLNGLVDLENAVLGASPRMAERPHG
jgi:hypothetical protein